MHVLIAMADFERSLIKERTLAGLKAARARGAVLGRPATLAGYEAKVATLRSQGLSVRAIGKELRLPTSSVFKALKLAKAA